MVLDLAVVRRDLYAGHPLHDKVGGADRLGLADIALTAISSLSERPTEREIDGSGWICQ